MKIFISWSGDSSRAVAHALTIWLPFIFQDIQPWMSDHDISAGARWNTDLDTELESANFGILCLTPENLNAPWMLFEAGSLAKTVKVARVVPYLFHLTPTNIQPPLSQFQGVSADKLGTFKLLQSIDNARESNLPTDRLSIFFEKWWPDLQKELDLIPPTLEASIPQRPDRELLEEILQLIRRLQTRSYSTEYEMAAASTEDLLQYLGQGLERQKDTRIQSEEEGLQGKTRVAELELLRRFPNIFRRRDIKNSEES